MVATGTPEELAAHPDDRTPAPSWRRVLGSVDGRCAGVESGQMSTAARRSET